MTTADGAFVFTALPPGEYSLTGTKTGWTDGAFGRRRPEGSPGALKLVEGAQETTVNVRMWKFGAITGTVRDEADEPVVNAQVRVLLRAFSAGVRQLTSRGSATTDDRGVYRIDSLVPGEYVVVVPSKASTLPASIADSYWRDPNANGALLRTILSATGPLNQQGSDRNQRIEDLILQQSLTGATYPTLFYPAATSPAGASTVVVSSGEQRGGVDLRLRPVTTAIITGTVVGPDGPVAMQGLRLVQQGTDDLARGSGLDTAVTLTDSKGAFTLLAVPPGQYVLRSLRVPQGARPPGPGLPAAIPSEPTLWAAEPVVVGDKDVALNITLRPGSRVSGRFEFLGGGPPPSADRLQQIPVTIEPVDNRDAGTIPPGHGDAAGGFTTFGLVPGRYFVRVGGSPSGWTFKSAMLDGRDVSDVPFDVRSADVTGIVITFTDTTNSVGGTVSAKQGGPDADATVLLFPIDPTSWREFGLNPRRIRSVRAGAGGAYTIASVPAGDYFVAAVPDELSRDWAEPQFLDRLSRLATRVRIEDGQKKVQDLKTLEIK
jgi:hypothetical protein